MNTSMKETADVLVVDDREDGLIALEAVLSDARTNVIKAGSGFEALDLIGSHDFAAILLDVQMPGIDGFETAHRIRESAAHRHIPILFVTAIDQDDRYVYRGYESGAVDYVFKPFDPIVLKSKVDVFINLHLKERKIREQEALLLQAERAERLRQLSELELEALRRYRSMADAIPHIVCRARADGALDYFNKVWIEYTGLSLEASVGDAWQSAVHPSDLQFLLKVWLEAMNESKSWEAEVRLRRHDGAYRWHLLRGTLDTSASGIVCGWIGSGTDIHERKVMEDELRIAKNLSDGANAAKTQFLANISHEIRTPLSAIIGFSDLLLNPSIQSERERLEYAVTIRRNGEQLLRLINEILDISKIEAGKLEVEILETDLSSVLEDVRPLFELQAEGKGLRFEIDCKRPVAKRIFTDPTRLRQILVNVVGNALKFTERGFVTLTLDHDDADPNDLRFVVSDSGIGIPESKRARLFQPFMQGDSSTSRRFGGTGLGLALSRKLAQSLGGDLRLRSSGSEGSTFELGLKCRPASDASFAVGKLKRDDNVFALEARGARENDAKLDGKRILLVDDAVDNQVLISRFLRLDGADVVVSGSGEDALAKIESDTSSFDLVLMDIQMPGMDGYAATAHLRSEGYEFPIIAFTAHALQSERDRCLNAGFDDHVTKPVKRATLVEKIRELSQKRTSSRRKARSARTELTT